MTAQFQILNKVLETKDYSVIESNNLNSDYFFTYTAEFNYIQDHYKKYGTVPDVRTFTGVFPEFKVELVQEPTNFLVSELKRDYGATQAAILFNNIKDKLESGDIDDAIATINNAHINLGTATSSTDVAQDFSRLDHYKERVSGNMGNYLSTGFYELDKMIGGIDTQNENMVIVARTGVGKSWVLYKMAANAFALGKRVGIYSGEMSVDKVALRIDTILSHISNRGLNHGDPYVQAAYESYIQHFKEGTLGEIVPNYLPGGCIEVLTPNDLGDMATVDQLKVFIEQKQLDILFVDQYSLLRDTSRARQPYEQVANISKAIKNLQVLTQKPIIAVSQMNRTGGKDVSGEEIEANSTQIGLSDRIGQDATTIIYLSKLPISDDGRVVKTFEPGQNYNKYLFTLTVGKARDGGEGKVEYAVDLDTFTEVPFTKGNKLSADADLDSLEESDSMEYAL